MNDSCPNCLRRDIPPAASRQRGGQVIDGYQCPACSHTWSTSRRLDAYGPGGFDGEAA